MKPVSLTGWVLDLLAARDGMELWFRTAGGENVTLFAPFRPSFAVAGRGVRETVVRAAAGRWRCDVRKGEGIEFFSGGTIPAWTFAVPAPFLLRATVRKAESAFGPETLFNADIASEQQFAFATGLFPFSFAEVECAGDGRILSARVLDSPWDVDPPYPPLSRAFLRAEGTGHPAHGRARPLVFSADGTTHVLCGENGTDFLREFLRLLASADPDLLVTEYGDDYLLPRILALAYRLRMPLPLGRAPRPPGRAAGKQARPAQEGEDPERGGIRCARERSYFSYGRVIFRAAPHTLSGRWHVDARNSFLFGETGLPGLIELSRLSGIPLQRMARSSPGTAISAMQIAAALSRGILVPYKKREPEGFKTGAGLVETDKGGLTYLPRPGLHGNVGELDFASMYPSLMDRYNISPETVNCRCCAPPTGRVQSRRDGTNVPAGNTAATGIPVPEIGFHTCARRRGLIPAVLSPILEKRRLLKERQKAAGSAEERDLFRMRQAALKWILVVCFGFLGYKNARFGRIEAHEAVTAWGREKLLAAKEIAEREGFSFLHGLTDAIWVKRGGASEDDYRRLAETISLETGMPIALEGIYRWLGFLPSKRNPSVAVPNRFVGAFTNGEVKARGIAMRRSDVPPFVAGLQRALLAAMAEAADVRSLRTMLPKLREIAETAAAELREGRVPPEALAIARRLSKAPERYVANTAAAEVTRELCGRGVTLPPGSKIRYLLTDGGGRSNRAGALKRGRTSADAAKQHGRAIGFLDGSEASDLVKYEEMLRVAAEEVLGLAGARPPTP
ncbi:MAG: DNA polymerase domain-containing protein [Candidatus Deferrimicrobiaceae bacterium]